jgi:multidrug efflux pump
MLCSRLLKVPDPNHRGWEEKFTYYVDRGFVWLRAAYERRLHGSLNYLPVTVVFALVVLSSIYFLFITAHTELAPQEDQGVIITQSIAAPNATLKQRQLYSHEVYKTFLQHPETEHVFQIDTPGQSISGMVMKSWDKRKKTTNNLQPVVQQELNKISGVRVVAFQPPPLPGSIGLPVQFVIGSTESFERLYDIAQKFLQQAQQSGNFIFLDCDLKIDNPQSNVSIDRDKTAQLGLKMSDVGGALASMLGGGYVNYFSMSGRSYKVIPQVQQRFRLNARQLLDYHIRTADGTLVPLSTVATVDTKTVPESLNHFQQLNSATIQGVAMPGVSQGEAIAYLQKLAAETLPRDYSIDYGGLSRQYVQETSGFVTTFGFALIIIFLALAALFESFRDPVIILVSVPMSIAGALIFVSIGIAGASLNIYTEVGLVTLMGLISKHGILIVQFANDLQAEGKSKREAIELAAGIRLRPILMTTAAMVLGVAPLITAAGAGAVSRFQMGLVIASGLSIGTLFTLFVVPAVYMLLAANRSKKATFAGAGGVSPSHAAPAE